MKMFLDRPNLAIVLSILLAPVFFFLIQSLREKVSRTKADN